MALTPMAPGGRWVRPPHDAPPVYVPAKQIEAHFKRLVQDGWLPIEGDPRQEMMQAQEKAAVEAQAIPSEVALQARIDQLESLVLRLLTQKNEQHDASTIDTISTDSEGSNTDQRPVRRRPAV